MKTAATLCLLASLAVGGPAFAAGKVKPPKPDGCNKSVGELLGTVAAHSKKMGVSPALDAKQLAYIEGQAKGGPASIKKEIDGAIVVGSDGEYIVVFTKGADAAAKVCAIMPVSPTAVLGIVAAGETPAKPDAKADPDELHL